MATTQQLTSAQWPQWIQNVDAFLFDCDGVLWVGDTPIQGANDMINLMRSLGKRVIFVVRPSA